MTDETVVVARRNGTRVMEEAWGYGVRCGLPERDGYLSFNVRVGSVEGNRLWLSRSNMTMMVDVTDDELWGISEAIVKHLEAKQPKEVS